jgi:hypothetical protein
MDKLGTRFAARDEHEQGGYCCSLVTDVVQCCFVFRFAATDRAMPQDKDAHREVSRMPAKRSAIHWICVFAIAGNFSMDQDSGV